MQKWLKRCVIMLLCISMLAIFSLVGCKTATTTSAAVETTAAAGETTSAAAATTATTTAVAEGPRTLKVVEFFLADIGNTAQYNMITNVYNQFKVTNACELDITSFGWGDIPKMLQIMAEAGSLPDVACYWFMNAGPLFVAKGLIDPLDPLIAKEAPEFMDTIDQRLMLKINKQVYGMPYALANMGLYVNKTILDKNGITAAPKTWQELRDMALKCTDASKGVYGLALNGGDEESLLVAATFIAQNGGHVGLFEGKQGINQPAAVEAMQFVIDMVTIDKSVPGYVSSGFKEARDIFNSGGAAFLIDASWDLKQIMPKNPEFEWYTSVLPMGKQNGTSIPEGDSAYSIFSSSENKDLAWEFIKFMTMDETILKGIVTARISYPTTMKSVNEYQIASETYGKYVKPFEDQLKLGNVLDVYGEMPNQLQDALNIWKEELQAAALGQKTVQEAMDTVAAGWDKLNADWVTQYGDSVTKDVAPPEW